MSNPHPLLDDDDLDARIDQLLDDLNRAIATAPLPELHILDAELDRLLDDLDRTTESEI